MRFRSRPALLAAFFAVPWWTSTLVACAGASASDSGTDGPSGDEALDSGLGGVAGEGNASGGATTSSGGLPPQTDGGSAGSESSGGAPSTGGSSFGGSAGAAAGGAAVGGFGGASTGESQSPLTLVATRSGTCAIDAAGAVQCWGGAGPWVLPTGGFVSLASGLDSICGVRADGSVACFDQPGSEPLGYDYVPAVSMREVAIGRGAACGIDLEGTPSCGAVHEALMLPPPAGERFSTLSVGTQFACGVRSGDGTLVCWGSAGSADACMPSPPAGQLNAPSGSYLQIASSTFSSCAVATDGSLSCWGAGEVADDPNALHCEVELYNFGQSAPPSGTFTRVAVGWKHSCAVRTDGTVACWGAGTVDSCEGDHCRQSLPPPGEFQQVAVGGWHSCAMRADKSIACWGWDGDGDGRTTPPEAFQ